MAIDTENKRRSVQAYTFGLVRPLADGTMTFGDRAAVAWLWFGLQATARRIRTAVATAPRQFTRSNTQPDYIRRG